MRKMRISVNYADPHRRILSDAMLTVHAQQKKAPTHPEVNPFWQG